MSDQKAEFRSGQIQSNGLAVVRTTAKRTLKKKKQCVIAALYEAISNANHYMLVNKLMRKMVKEAERKTGEELEKSKKKKRQKRVKEVEVSEEE